MSFIGALELHPCVHQANPPYAGTLASVFLIPHSSPTQTLTCLVMMAENISLGVLALPQALAILGLVPGLLCICFLGLIATYTGWMIGEFKLAHPKVQSFADCGFLIAGPMGREILAVAQVLILMFVMGAHILTFAVAMNAITEHGACTIIFSVVGLVACFLLGLPRTFKNVSYFSIFCEFVSFLWRYGGINGPLTDLACLSIIIAVLVAMIAISIEKPDMGDMLTVRRGIPLVKGLGPVMNIILAYSTSSFPSIHQHTLELTLPSRPRRLLLLPSGAQEPRRLSKSPLLLPIHCHNILHDNIGHNILLRWSARCLSRTRLRVPPHEQDLLRPRHPNHHRCWCGQRQRGVQVHILENVGRHGCSA